MRANKYDYLEAINWKITAEGINRNDRKAVEAILGRCVMGTRLIKEYRNFQDIAS